MAHPVQLISELSTLYPALSFQMWVYGAFNSTMSHAANGVKGILAATENNLIFFGKEKDGQNLVLELDFDNIDSISFQTAPYIITCHLQNGGYVEMSFISRGDPESLATFLENTCGRSSEEN